MSGVVMYDLVNEPDNKKICECRPVALVQMLMCCTAVMPWHCLAVIAQQAAYPALSGNCGCHSVLLLLLPLLRVLLPWLLLLRCLI
jgi:hypothetical protein